MKFQEFCPNLKEVEMKEDVVEFVDYQEPLIKKVGRFLQTEGFDLGDNYGRDVKHVTNNRNDSIGILYKDPKYKWKHLFGFKKRRIFIGILWLNWRGSLSDNDYWLFDPKQKYWTLEVYGREYVNLAMEIAKKISLEFNLNKVTVRLMSEEAKYPSELCI